MYKVWIRLYEGDKLIASATSIEEFGNKQDAERWVRKIYTSPPDGGYEFRWAVSETDPGPLDEVPEQYEVEVTCEVTARRSYSMTISRSDYEMLLEGDTSPIEGMFDETIRDSIGTGDYEKDFTVFNIDTGKQVVDWNWK